MRGGGPVPSGAEGGLRDKKGLGGLSKEPLHCLLG